ncbi:MarC family protein [Porphyromonas pogonae]|uniref:MarC family protein n=1 Tax=Porphyromonas pogonae TaxID=867595 RepID=UPI002E76BD7B|nr:MarC family protein [Porphyromonas pogonae]
MEFWNNILHELSLFDFREILGSFMILFVAVDIIGAIPIILSLKDKGQNYNSFQVSFYSCIMLLAFLFIGEPMLGFFGVDISSFAVAGGIVLFVLAVEMIFGIQVFKDDGPSASATFVPLVFPLFAGAASFTTLLTLRADGYAMINLVLCVIFNMSVVFLVLKFVNPVERFFGKGGIYVLRKFFGVILLAISVKFITGNILRVIDIMHAANQ